MTREQALDEKAVVGALNEILELELAGVVRYTHYSLMIFGYGRIPIVGWMREQSAEAVTHATLAGEHVTRLGAHPSLKIGRLLESHKHDIGQILHECIAHERGGIAAYRRLLELVVDRSVVLEEYARRMIHDEEIHASEIEKMLRKPGHLESAP